jgi:hypothetical protein
LRIGRAARSTESLVAADGKQSSPPRERHHVAVVPATFIDRWAAAESQWVTDAAIAFDLPTLASEALVTGWDSPSLRLLAGLDGVDPRDARDVFLRAISELGRQLPAPELAAAQLTRFYADQVLDGAVEPIRAATAIGTLAIDLGDRAPGVAQAFVGLDDEWTGGWGRSCDAIEAEILELAREAQTDLDPPR